MTTLQKALIAAIVVAAIGTGIYEARQALTLRSQVQTSRQQQAPLIEQIKQLRQQRDDATNKLAALQQENERLHRDTVQLAKLRGEVARLRPLENDISTLQKVANASVSSLAEWKPDQLMNAGRTAPQDALQTYLWSATTTNLSELGQCFVANESDPPTEDEIHEFVPTNLLSKDAQFKIKVLSQTIVSPNEVVLTVARQLEESGRGLSAPVTLRNVNGEWKLVLFKVRDAAGKVIRLDLGTKLPPR